MLPLRMLGPLFLMILLCDAETSCPTGSNPLILDPPEIIEEYGKSVLVHCNSTAHDHNGMYWTNGSETFDVKEVVDFISWRVPLLGWDVKAQCRIKLSGTAADYECSKDLKIITYKNPDGVDLYPTNHKDDVTQNTLQCDIIDVAPVENLVVRWYKDNQTIRTESVNNKTKTPVSVSSNLTVSREENGAQIRCEAQLDFGKDGPQLPAFPSNIHTVSVHYAPELINDKSNISVQEGDNVTLNCEADGNPPPVFHWNNDGRIMSETTISLYIDRVNISVTYNCTATNYLGSITKQFHVEVMKTRAVEVITTPAVEVITTPAVEVITTPAASAPRGCPLTLTPAEIVVKFGDPASVNCSTAAINALMGWEASIGGSRVEGVSHVVWMVDKLEDWTIKPSCWITPTDYPQCELSPVITLYKIPDIVAVSALHDGPMVEGTEYQLICDVLGVAPLQSLKVKWYRGNETVHTQTFNETSVTPVSVSSTLNFTAARDHNGTLFRCKAELHLGANGPELIPTASSAPYLSVVHYKPLLPECPGSYSGVEHEFSLSMVPCQADGNPPPTIRWYNQGALMNASEPLNRTASGKYTAEAVNILGSTRTSVDVTIEYSPSFTCGHNYEMEENGELQPKCEPEGEPTPIKTWLTEGGEKTSQQSWTKHDSGKYILTATNKLGTAIHSMYIDVLYAPVLKEENETKVVTPGENVTLHCSAEGNPDPEIVWKYDSVVNVRETTGGRQRNVSVTGATSTNAGVYSCIATNKVGSVSRSVTLIMKGRQSSVQIAVISVFVIMLLVALILILILKNRKRHGRYSFIDNNNGSDIPLNTNQAG